MKQAMKNPKQAEEAVRKAYAETELILSSIPSILIGVNQEGLITHWNTTAENSFGIPASTILRHPFSSCDIQWDFKKMAMGLSECQTKNKVVRVDDICFRRSNGEERFLGFNIIPVCHNSDGDVEFIFFGADITDRRRIEQLKNEFVSMVSHELRTPLTVIKEGVSQVLEELLGGVNDGQKRFLTIALEGIERLGRIVDDLLDISKIESGKLELKREPVDMGGVIREVQAAFGQHAKEKGLEIGIHLPSEKVEIYADRDKLVQVFVNLVSNAFKFTEKGRIDISLKDKEASVQCTVADTGAGIPEADLPRVFGKFQQFARVPSTKGTGLGLAISKGIVEAHGGQIGIESRWGQGTKFTFTLPHFTAKELFRRHISHGLKEALGNESSFSAVVFDFENYEKAQEKIGHAKTVEALHALGGLAQYELRKRGDAVMRDDRTIFMVLPSTGKEGAQIAAKRMERAFENHLLQEGLKEDIHIQSKIASFPDDGHTEEELLNKVEVE